MNSRGKINILILFSYAIGPTMFYTVNLKLLLNFMRIQFGFINLTEINKYFIVYLLTNYKKIKLSISMFVRHEQRSCN